jgi:hypothetical protein
MEGKHAIFKRRQQILEDHPQLEPGNFLAFALTAMAAVGVAPGKRRNRGTASTQSPEVVLYRPILK